MQFDQVSVGKKANVFFDGKCVSHTVTLPNGVRKSVGVVLPSTLRFDLRTKEVMEVVDGNAFVSINGAPEQEFKAGQSWEVEKGGYFIIRAEQPVHYALEMNKQWFSDRVIVPGSAVTGLPRK